ncbi:MAG TPA: class I SAM-dependent methyltransferase [Burkholderiales bacterium]|nr:class I SAM-dependent methyltransferase [Burkholderiales bacterium]
MNAARARTGLALALALAAAGPVAAVSAPLDIPTPYVPSTTVAVDEMLRVAEAGPGDLVVDLGSGDGRIVIAAARDYGARGLGVEIDADLVAESRANAERAGVSDRVAFVHGDALQADVRSATVVALYLLPSLLERLKPKLLAELRPGTRIVAHDYGFADWKPDRTVLISKTYYLYVVPAQVGGRWRLHAELPGGSREYEIEFEQRYQEIRGGARVPGGYLPAFEARLSGERVSFVLVEDDASHHFEGRVRGLSMEGEVHSGPGRSRAVGRWRATRIVRGAEEG